MPSGLVPCRLQARQSVPRWRASLFVGRWSHMCGINMPIRPGLQVNPLDLVEADVSMAPVIPLRGAPRRVIGHCRGVLERATAFQIGGDARGAQRVVADRSPCQCR